MADFFVRVLKWLAAMVVAYFLLFILVFFVIIGIGIAFQPPPKSVEPGSILVLDLGFNLTDQPSDENPADLLRGALEGNLVHSASLRQVIEALEAAGRDSDISGLLIKGNLPGGNFATLRELRQALIELGKNKPVWSYLDMESLRDVYLKSAATKVFSNTYSGVDFRGLRGERLYLGEAFEKIGVDVQVEAFEEYKSAAEAYQLGTMSDEEKIQLGSLLEDIWNVLLTDIAFSRELDPETLDTIAGKELVLLGEEVLDAGFSDEIVDEDVFIDLLSEVAGYDSEKESFRQFRFSDYMNILAPDLPILDIGGSGNEVGIAYIEGILLDGEGSDGYVGSDRLSRTLRELRRDDAVKAVVLRINSPGGSATASSKVAREIGKLSAKKPVVVSMGGMAASAGYMMAAAGEQIFAQPLTITGSIGVVVMLPNIEGLADKMSVSFEGVETHPFAGTFSLGRKKTPEEMRQVRELAAGFYDEFLEFVSVNREMPYGQVREVARGRIWSGTQALEIGLVDELGGLMAAVQRAADLAGIGNDFKIIERPKRMSIEEQIEEWLVNASAQAPAVNENRTLIGAFKDFEEEFVKLSILNDPFGQYAILPYTLKFR